MLGQWPTGEREADIFPRRFGTHQRGQPMADSPSLRLVAFGGVGLVEARRGLLPEQVDRVFGVN